MDPSLRAQLEKVLLERCAAVADGWYQAIARTSYLPLPATEIRRQLADLACQAAALLVDEPFDGDSAQSSRLIGASLAQLHCLQPEGLGQTIGVLARGFVEGLPADQAAALHPSLAVLVEGVATGFARQVREAILAEQESIRGALVGELKVTEKSLRESGRELEVRVQERTAELARANEELRLEIAERRQAEEALRESEATTRALLNAPADLVVLADSDGILLDVNEAFAERFGKSPSELIGTCGWDWLPPDVAERRRSYHEAVFQSGIPVRFEDERLGQWFDNRVYPICDKGGRVVKVALVARDITDLKQSEQALRESEATARALLNAPSDVILLADSDGILIDVNEAMVKRLGRPVTELIGTCGWDWLPPDVAERRRSYHEVVIRSGKPVRFEDTREGRWYDIRIYPICDMHGKVVKIASVTRDITDLKQAEQALRESEERWRSLVQNAPDHVVTVDREARILFTNRGGPGPDLPASSFIGRKITDWVPPEAQELVRQAIEKVFVEGGTGYFEAPAKLPDGTKAWFANHLGAIRRDGELVEVINIAHDITERRQVEEIKDNLIRDVSHELRTPLAKIQMSLDLLLELLDKDPMNRQRAIGVGQMIFGSVQRLLRTVETILDLSILESGRVVFEQVQIPPAVLIDDALQYMQPMAEAKGLQLVARAPADLPTVKGDWEQLSRVLINLIDNAIKFSERGQIVISARENEHEVQFAVSDQGSGIHKENLGKIFERFYQERPQIPGAGIGLPICQRIVQAHGGRIWAESPGSGQGTTVRFALIASSKGVE